ncbi:MAG: aspartate aminotransferase family protein [Clostridia bacterium]
MNIKEINDKYVMNTYGKFNLQLDEGLNAVCWNENGKKFIDFTSGIGVNSLGFCNKIWLDAVIKQASCLQHTSNLYYTKPSAMLAQSLCLATGYTNVFFANSVADANEGAIKLARKYSFDKYGLGRHNIICLNNSFHGRTLSTLSATGQDVFHNYFFPFVEGFLFAEANNFESVKKLADSTVCAVMLEVIQGEGGVNALNKAFVEDVSNLCQQKDWLLIVDEVQTGVGRTGAILASEHYKIKPDVTTLAKGLGGGLPIGAILANEKCSKVLGTGTHATTFGANPVICAGALAVFNTIKKKEFLMEVCDKSDFMRQEILKMKGVKGVSGKGLMIGIELKNNNAKDVVNECVEKGLLCLTAKEKIRLLPPLSITYDEICEGLAILSKVLGNIN